MGTPEPEIIKVKYKDPWWKVHKWFRQYYVLNRPFNYYSPRYDKWKTAPVGEYDGATGAIDVCPRAWLIHDAICFYPYWDDGEPISREQAAQVLSDRLEECGRHIRKYTWKWSTYWFGCKRAKENG